MKVPEGLSSSAISELYVIPPISNDYVDTEAEFVVPRPNFSSITEQAQVKIQKLDSRRWIAINSSPSEVWPRIQHFLEENKIETTMTDPANGEIETAWLVLKDESSSKDRYHIKVEQGIHANSSEIHVIQVTVTNAVPGNGKINWPATSVNPEREKWLVDKLASYLTADDKAGATLLAQSVGGARKVDFIQPYQSEPFLVFTLDMERVWASVGGAVSQHPFAMVDLNRSEGTYQVTFDPTPVDKEKPGFFCRLFWCDKRAAAAREKNLLHYQLQIHSTDNNEVKLFVKSASGEALPIKDAEKLLSILRNQ